MSCEYCPPKSRTTTSSVARGAWTSVVSSSTRLGTAVEAVTTESVMTPRGCGGPRSSTRARRAGWLPGSSCAEELLLALRVRRRGRAAGAHPDALGALELLALGLQRRGDHQLGPVEL